MRKVLLSLACWATISLASARADIVYQYVTDKTTYLGNLGATVPVNIFLQETVTGTSTSLIFSQGGLFGAAVLVNSPSGAIFGSFDSQGNPIKDFKISPNVAASPVGFGPVPTITDFTLPPASLPSNANQSGLIVNADIAGSGSPPGNSSGPKVASGGPGVNKILIGTLNVSVAATPATLNVTPYDGSANTITQAGTDLDLGTQNVNGYTGARNSPSWNFTVAVVPEPSSMALCGLVACGMSYAGFRRRKATASEPVAIV